MKDHNGDVHTFMEPVVAGKCETETDEEGHVRSRQFVCSGTTASQNYYNASSCSGNPVGSDPVTVKGTCAMGGCAGFTHYDWNDGHCQGKPQTTTTNEYIYWGDGSCQNNATQSCVNGVPTIKFYDDAACTGNPRHTLTSGMCNPHGGHGSDMMNVTDSPC
eukprot:CAMPEP_0201576422 /NCGR_PEP_ID=MMETSP0190_2-20130828/22248_1 /ASSEMBLY_ACC=CAM_ASM_000263 /TAXON_ID=37353 /ORGANISM="Rosalina sp." /LENGTH=160 /DNA_ID=CAMNT_0048007287 /DNA_START=174 /DNA_END=656 /DNA_ORIENTATION=-